jgi:outer membrane autotransporter protein
MSGKTGAMGARAWVGSLNPDTTTLGVYWTHKTASNAYLDAVLQHSWYGGEGFAVTGLRRDIGGSGNLASLEIGKGFALPQQWTFETQAQLVYHRSRLDDIAIPNATVSFGNNDSLVTRVGVRLVGNYRLREDRPLKPYLRANWWHGFNGAYDTTFIAPAAATQIDTRAGYDMAEIGLGFTLALTRGVSVYGEIDHAFALGNDVVGGELSKGVSAALGIRLMFGR